MAKRSKGQIIADALEAHRQGKLWRQRVRRMAVESLRWIRTITGDLPEDAKDQRLHEIEIAQRQVKAQLWMSIPDCRRWEGTKSDRRQLDKDRDRWKALNRLDGDASQCVKAIMDRRHGPMPVLEPANGSVRLGPFDIALEDLGSVLDMSVQDHNERQKKMSNQIARKPDGSIAVPHMPPVPVMPMKPGRPQPPPTPPMAIEKALTQTIPFGKHKGMTIEWLLGDRESIGYLQWLCTKADIQSSKLREALSVVYEHYEGEIDSRTPPEDSASSPSHEPIDEDEIPF